MYMYMYALVYLHDNHKTPYCTESHAKSFIESLCMDIPKVRTSCLIMVNNMVSVATEIFLLMYEWDRLSVVISHTLPAWLNSGSYYC